MTEADSAKVPYGIALDAPSGRKVRAPIIQYADERFRPTASSARLNRADALKVEVLNMIKRLEDAKEFMVTGRPIAHIGVHSRRSGDRQIACGNGVHQRKVGR